MTVVSCIFCAKTLERSGKILKKIRWTVTLVILLALGVSKFRSVLASGDEPVILQNQNGFIVQTEYDKQIIVEDGMEFHYIVDDTWQGVMVIVKDPSRLFVGMPRDSYGAESGKNLSYIASRYGARYAVNGGFFDVSKNMEASTPIGIVVSQGRQTAGSLNSIENIIGWDNQNNFVCGPYTGKQIQQMGIRDAISCTPVLVLNGQVIPQNPTRMDARTAIGARADGSVLILSIDGRMSHSVGATWQDAAECMYKFGAVNAGNIDGGGSSGIYYNGITPIQNMSNVFCDRKIPNAICVRPQ